VSGNPTYLSCAKYGKNHLGEFLVGQKFYYGCGKLGHGIKKCPHTKQESRDVRPQTQATSAPAPLGQPIHPQGASSSTGGGQRQNQLCALPSH